MGVISIREHPIIVSSINGFRIIFGLIVALLCVGIAVVSVFQ